MMLSPEAIVAQVWQRIVPTDWKIIRGKRRSAFSFGVSAAIWTFAGIIALALLAALINDLLISPRAGSAAPLLRDFLALQSASLAGYPALAVGAAAAAALPALVGLVAWLANARRHAGDPDPVIVLLPEGFVEYVSRHQPIIGIRYANVAAASVGQGKQPRQPNQPGAAPAARPASRSKVWLHLVYRDGRADRWMPRANFGPPERLYETITKAHTLYAILYGDRR